MTDPTPDDVQQLSPAQRELIHRFNYHAPPGQAVVRAHELVRNMCCAPATMAIVELPDCRERSLMLTKLEEAMFWGNAAIARNHEAFPDEPDVDEPDEFIPSPVGLAGDLNKRLADGMGGTLPPVTSVGG